MDFAWFTFTKYVLLVQVPYQKIFATIPFANCSGFMPCGCATRVIANSVPTMSLSAA